MQSNLKIGPTGAPVEEDDRVDVIEVVVERSDEHTVDVTVTVNVKGDDTLQNIELTHRIKKLKN